MQIRCDSFVLISKFKANTFGDNINYWQEVSDNAIVLKWIQIAI